MVHLPTLEAMRKMYSSNLEQYVKDHPGEFVLIEKNKDWKLKARFYKTRQAFENATKKYKGYFGSTFLTDQIPKKTHQFKKDNIKGTDFSDKYVEFCPNDLETRLVVCGPVECTHDNGKKKYSELAYCPDCNYHVYRKPSEKTIRQSEERLKKLVFN